MEQRSPGDAESEASVDVESGESKCSCKCGVCEAGRSSNEPPCHVCDEGDGGWWRECPCIECWGGTSRNDRCGCGGPGSCVNGQWFDPGQECSDGNTVAWDGCTVGWATERQVNSFSMGRQEAPRVEALRGGGFVVVWTSRPWAASDLAQDGDDCGVVGRVFDGNGVPKGNEFVVNTVVEGWQWSPAVAAFPDGSFLVAWVGPYSEEPGADLWDWAILGQAFSGDGSKLGKEVPLAVALEANAWQPALEELGPANAAFAWTYGNLECCNGAVAYGGALFGGVVSAAGEGISSFAEPNPCGDGSDGYGPDKSPGLVPLAGGAFLETWIRVQGKCPYGPQHEEVLARKRSSQGLPVGEVFSLSGPSQEIHSFGTVPFSDGSFVACWVSHPLGAAEELATLKVQRFSGEGGVIGFELAPDNTGKPVGECSVASWPSGAFAVAWTRADSDCHTAVYVRGFGPAGGAVGEETQVSRYRLQTHSAVQIARLEGGNIVVAWQQHANAAQHVACEHAQDGDESGIFVRQLPGY